MFRYSSLMIKFIHLKENEEKNASQTVFGYRTIQQLGKKAIAVNSIQASFD